MTQENKVLSIVLVLTTLFIGMTLSIIVLFILGERAAYFFGLVFAVPIGAVCSLLVLMLYKAMQSNKG